jgi:chaperone required for assembly of F1-ATPase
MVGMSKAKMEARALPKRFYKDVALQQASHGHAILLDGKELKTQGRNALHIAPQQLAEGVAEEWRAQTTHINPDTMPLTRLMNITLDRMQLDRLAVLEQVCAYGETDLVCYRDAQVELQHRQAAAFDPLVAWVREAFGIDLHITEGIMPALQSTASLEHFRVLFAAANDAELAALAMLVPLLGSAVLALAVWKQEITVEDALVAARLDEDFQAERWGMDPEAASAWAAKCIDIRASAFFLTCRALK